MIMTQNLRKLALTLHVAFSVGLLGSIAAFLALTLVGLNGQDEPTIRSAYWAMNLVARFVVVPLAFASLVTGLVQSLGTPWGLFRHYWVVTKLLLTVFATAILLIKLDLIAYAAEMASEPVLAHAEIHAIGQELALHAMGGLMVLIAPVVLSIYKPRGLTSYGRRTQQDKRTQSQNRRPRQQSSSGIRVSTANGTISLTLRPVYVLGFIAFVLFAHVLILHLAGAAQIHH